MRWLPLWGSWHRVSDDGEGEAAAAAPERKIIAQCGRKLALPLPYHPRLSRFVGSGFVIFSKKGLQMESERGIITPAAGMLQRF